MSSFGNHFMLLIFFNFYIFCQGTITQTPSTACVGDRITVSCILTPPAGQTFQAVTPRFLIGNSNTSLSAFNINDSNSHPDVDLTRLTAYNNAGSVTMVSGVVTLLYYLTSDEGLRIGCEVSRNNGMDLIEYIQLIQAAPPAPISLQSFISNFNTASCSANMYLTWNTPPSNRTVDRYFLYLDGSPLATTNSNSYIHSTILNINTDYQYSVTAMSCAGNSTNNSTSTVNYVLAPPSPPISLQSSVSNFNTATCSADISLSWNTPPSNRTVDRYFLYLDGSLLATTNSNSYIHSTILNINTNYPYSVTAMSCAGNSTTSSSNFNSVASYSLMRRSQFVCLAYDKVTGGLTVNWGLSTPTQPSGVSGLDITYSLQLLYSHSRQSVTYSYTDSTNFTLPSSQLSYNTVLTAHNFAQLDGVETNIAINLMIVQQCGQSFSGAAKGCFFDSNNPPTPPTSPTNIPTSSSISDLSSIYLPTIISIALILFISLIINLLFIAIIFLLLRRNKQSKSPSNPAPSHPYEYIDLDKMSGNISSPTQQQSPQDYVHMNPVHKQDSTQPPTHYANLK